MIAEVTVRFPARLTPLPDGYRVVYLESDEHYHVVRPDGEYDGPYSDKWMARRVAFATAMRAAEIVG